MDKMNVHLTANLTLIFLFWIISLAGIWTFLPCGAILKAILSMVVVAVSGYIGHWLFPRFTGPIIEKVYKARQ